MTNSIDVVKVGGGNLGFNAAHFITYGGKCEKLHGHNYQVSVEVEATLNADGIVFDFTILKQFVRKLCQNLDHQFILPLFNPHLTITERPTEWEISYEGRRYIFPHQDVVPLPIDNSSAERLAGYIADNLLNNLEEVNLQGLVRLTVGVAESPLQTAFHSRFLG